MARSASRDVYDKFRFKVVFFDFSGTTSITFNEDNFISGGFSEVLLPKATIGERTYRENIDPLRVTKAPGITSYEPVTFRRGKVGDNRQLYNWYSLVNNEAAYLSPINTILADQNFIPVYSSEYRREISIQLLDRQGVTKRAWILFNAFPISYKGGDDLNSSAEDKLLEELVVSYETFIELKDDQLDTINGESERAASIQAIAAIASAIF